MIARRNFQVDVRPRRSDNFIEGGMTVLPNAMATRDRFLTTVKALERALRQAGFDRPATDSAPFFYRAQWYIPADAWIYDSFGLILPAYCILPVYCYCFLAGIGLPHPRNRFKGKKG